MWNIPDLERPPRVHPATGFNEAGVEALFYETLAWRGKPTRTFAWLGLPRNRTGKVPAMVLVHGGGGTAFAQWVRMWTGRGYAALAMDMCGSVPQGNHEGWERHACGGPPGWGGFDQVAEPVTDQWVYHAVADILLGISLLANRPEIDAEKIGITGVSWGGFLTGIVSGLDRRLKCAAPVYGSGFIGEDSPWLIDFDKMGPVRRDEWIQRWDSPQYLSEATLPMLWVNGTNDFAYPLSTWQRSYRLTRGPRTLSVILNMPHGHGGPGECPVEIHQFCDWQLKDGHPLMRLADLPREGDTVGVTWESEFSLMEGNLLYTQDSGKWVDRVWRTRPVTFHWERFQATAPLPAGATAWYFNLKDFRGVTVSSEHHETPP
ncbi:MAG: acetylxylan esterase [Verrucomicrobiae bacterium]|nr:acetylxylan esterase [Verrucomicrobiae bacterium]